METVIVVGTETVVGANLAAVLADQYRVIGVASVPLNWTICPLEVPSVTGITPSEVLSKTRTPSRVVYCGSGSRSSWDGPLTDPEEIAHLSSWLDASLARGCPFTMISSDAVFTGPWMFHAESGTSFCPSPQARHLKSLEDLAVSRRSDTLLIRTHALGWGPVHTAEHRESWLDQLMTSFETLAPMELDFARHASPILATELARVVARAWTAGLTGVYHVAGAERTNPFQLARRIAQVFGRGLPPARHAEALDDSAHGFGCGETSLQTRKVRRALGVSLPLLADSLQQLHEQTISGYRARLQGSPRSVRAA